MMKHLLFTLLILSCFFSAKAQNHFYTTIKAPLSEFIVAMIRSDDNDRPADIDDETDGVGFNAGYAFKMAPNFYNEIGFDYLILNKAVRTSFTDETRLENRNSIFAFQIKTNYRPSISADNDVFLTVGIAFNYQQIYSEGSFNDGKTSSYSTDKKQGNWFVNAQPNLGIEFKGPYKLGYRFGLSFLSYDWTKVEEKLRFKNNPNLVARPHVTSNVFFSGGFIF